MNTNKFFGIVISLFLFSLFMIIKQIYAQVPYSHPSRSDEIQDTEELRFYFRWLPDRIEVSPPNKRALPPRNTICIGNGHFHSFYQKINGKDRYWLGASCTDNSCPQSYRLFLRDMLARGYQSRCVAICENTIFPLYGSLYCLDKPINNPTPYNVTSAFRISDNDIPSGLTLQRRSIIIPICEDTTLLSGGDDGGSYDGQYVYITDYGQSPIPSEGLQVKITNTLMSQEEHKRAYEEYKHAYEEFRKRNPHVPSEECPIGECKRIIQGWYKIGDVVPFTTVAHKIINIVLPDKEDCRIVHRKNKDGSITELKCRLAGWMELDPTPIPLNKN
jgi:hypothetical protein